MPIKSILARVILGLLGGAFPTLLYYLVLALESSLLSSAEEFAGSFIAGFVVGALLLPRTSRPIWPWLRCGGILLLLVGVGMGLGAAVAMSHQYGFWRSLARVTWSDWITLLAAFVWWWFIPLGSLYFWLAAKLTRRYLEGTTPGSEESAA